MKRPKKKNFDVCQARRKIADIVYHGGASHIGTSFSVVEILAAVFQTVDLAKIKQKAPDRDRIILSKGHAAAALYVVMGQAGLLTDEELSSYYQNGSLLSGHVSHFVPFVEHSTGALGHGLPVGVGIGLGLKSQNFLAPWIYVIMGDGELNEGSNWEALMLAGHHRLNNLCVLVDNNNLGGVGKTSDTCSLMPLTAKFKSFGFAVVETDGHDVAKIMAALKPARKSLQPAAVICHTVKGKGASFMEGNNVWHYRPLQKADRDQIHAELGED